MYVYTAQISLDSIFAAAQVPDVDDGVRQGCLKECSDILEKGCARARYNKYVYEVFWSIISTYVENTCMQPNVNGWAKEQLCSNHYYVLLAANSQNTIVTHSKVDIK